MNPRAYTEPKWTAWIAQERHYMAVKGITVAARIKRAKELLGADTETGEFNRRLLAVLTQDAAVAV